MSVPTLDAEAGRGDRTADPPGDRNRRPQRSTPSPLDSSAPAGGAPRFHAGQIVATQAVLALLLAASGGGTLVAAASWLTTVILLLTIWIRARHRWLFEWAGIGLCYLVRRRTLVTDPPTPTGGPAPLDLVAPRARVLTDVLPDGAAAIADDGGLTAMLELGDPDDLLPDRPPVLPSPASLLPPPDPFLPPTRVQLVLTTIAAPSGAGHGGAAAASYRQLTDGRIPRQERAVLAVRVFRVEDRSLPDLLRVLADALRKVRRRLAPLSARPLDEHDMLAILAETAQYDPAKPTRESWSHLQLGGRVQTSFRMERWPDAGAEAACQLVTRLLALPTVATTVALTAQANARGSVSTDLTVRLATDDVTSLTPMSEEVHRLLTAAGARAHRMDGEQRNGLLATLPVGFGKPVRAPLAVNHLQLPLRAAGLMIGVDRRGAPVVVRLFRVRPTSVVLIGGLPGAQIVVARALGLGARVVVRTARPQAWASFLRGAVVPGEEIKVVPPGRDPVDEPPGTPMRPLLTVVDADPTAPGPAASGWTTELIVRDELAQADTRLLARSDLAVLQQLHPDEAALAGRALGLGESAQWLSRMGPDMIAVINRQALRWALFAVTPAERQLVGPPDRLAPPHPA